MIYYCADDYGLCEEASEHIKQCIDRGVLNKVSVFPNFDGVDLSKISENKKIRISLHLNLVEGRCMSDAGEISLLADANGNFKNRFGGLFKLWLFNGKELEAQLYKEIKAQVLFWKGMLPEGEPFCIDSHQHTHMIPAVFRAMVSVLKDEGIKAEYIRIPVEPLLPFITTPSLYLTYSPVNIVKQWLLKLMWLIDRGQIKDYNIPTACFLGILFSGKMDQKRVSRILKKYKDIAQKRGSDIEVLFHPGYLEREKCGFHETNIVFEKFYLSENRKTEYDSVMNYRKEVQNYALH